MRNYRYRVEPYVAGEHRDGCLALLDRWKIHQDAQHLEESNANAVKRAKESIATALCLDTAGQLGLKGLVVYVECSGDAGEKTVPVPVLNPVRSDRSETGCVRDFVAGGETRAFTFGEYLGNDQSSITIEKTDLEVKGLAQFIFSEFCRANWADRPLVNVGDDWGLETLAWTKMSYRPVKLLQKYVLRKPAPVSVAPGAAPAAPSHVTAAAGRDPAGGPADLVERAQAMEPMEPMPRLQGDTPLPVTVRVADKKDVPAALELERACFSPSVSLKKRQLQYLQQRHSAVFLVAEQGGALVGEGIALLRRHKTGTSGRIYSLAVEGRRRGQRIGDKLLSAILDTLAARGARRIYLEVERSNAGAIRLYERHGFRRIGTLPDYYGKGKDGVHMMAQVPAVPAVRVP
jgi:ribosomal protein S18 acetylase RimI-like enzyme